MICRRNDGRFNLVGIISWGREDCIHDEHPSVLTKVSTYRDWIDSHIGDNNIWYWCIKVFNRYKLYKQCSQAKKKKKRSTQWFNMHWHYIGVNTGTSSYIASGGDKDIICPLNITKEQNKHLNRCCEIWAIGCIFSSNSCFCFGIIMYQKWFF